MHFPMDIIDHIYIRLKLGDKHELSPRRIPIHLLNVA